MDTFSHSQASDWEALCTALILTSLLLLHNDDDDDDDAGRDEMSMMPEMQTLGIPPWSDTCCEIPQR